MPRFGGKESTCSDAIATERNRSCDPFDLFSAKTLGKHQTNFGRREIEERLLMHSALNQTLCIAGRDACSLESVPTFPHRDGTLEIAYSWIFAYKELLGMPRRLAAWLTWPSTDSSTWNM